MICDICQADTEVTKVNCNPIKNTQLCDRCLPLLCSPGNHPPMSVCERCPKKGKCEVK
jgi:hypothetical protein